MSHSCSQVLKETQYFPVLPYGKADDFPLLYTLHWHQAENLKIVLISSKDRAYGSGYPAVSISSIVELVGEASGTVMENLQCCCELVDPRATFAPRATWQSLG